MRSPHVITTRYYESPCGRLLLGAFGEALCLCDWRTGKSREVVDRRLQRRFAAVYEAGTSPVLTAAAAQLDAFFAGVRTAFDLPLALAGTPFQETVWRALCDIPYGETVSYGELARRIGMPGAVRAVANANGANALSVFIPCHRVIGADRTLTGYGGGLAAKQYLLALETRTLNFKFAGSIQA